MRQGGGYTLVQRIEPDALTPPGIGPDSLNPPYKGRGEADRGKVISREPVIASCDPPEVLQPVEGTLDAPAQLVETLIEAERLFSIALVWNDRLGSPLMEFGAQSRAVVGLVTERMF